MRTGPYRGLYMTDEEPVERQQGVNRVEAFSDGVIAIIITIMVLELNVPKDKGLAALWQIWPVFLAYILSYAYVAIYWINHHRLFGLARRVTGGLLWANNGLLFTLSMVPFSTAYLGEHHFERDGTILYLLTLLLPALAYLHLQKQISITGAHTLEARHYHHATMRKTMAAVAVYSCGIGLSFLTPWLGVAAAALVGVFWMLPWSMFDKVFLLDLDTKDRD